MPDARDTEDRARRAAKRVGLAIMKSRQPTLRDNNHGHLMLFDPIDNQIIGGKRYDMTRQDVIDWCGTSLADPHSSICGILRSPPVALAKQKAIEI
jgi:hypothetical protein